MKYEWVALVLRDRTRPPEEPLDSRAVTSAAVPRTPLLPSNNRPKYNCFCLGLPYIVRGTNKPRGTLPTRAGMASTYANRPRPTQSLVCITTVKRTVPAMRPTTVSLKEGATSDARLILKEATAVGAAVRTATAVRTASTDRKLAAE